MPKWMKKTCKLLQLTLELKAVAPADELFRDCLDDLSEEVVGLVDMARALSRPLDGNEDENDDATERGEVSGEEECEQCRYRETGQCQVPHALMPKGCKLFRLNAEGQAMLDKMLLATGLPTSPQDDASAGEQ